MRSLKRLYRVEKGKPRVIWGRHVPSRVHDHELNVVHGKVVRPEISGQADCRNL